MPSNQTKPIRHRRPKVTPKLAEQIAESYAETVNFCETARRFGLNESTVRSILNGNARPNYRELNARACERGLRRGRKSLRGCTAVVDQYLEMAKGDNPTLEPQDVSKLVHAQVAAVGGMVKLSEHILEQRVSRLTREKARLEIKLLELRTQNFDEALTGATPEELEQIQAILQRSRARVHGTTTITSEGNSTTNEDRPTES